MLRMDGWQVDKVLRMDVRLTKCYVWMDRLTKCYVWMDGRLTKCYGWMVG